MGWSELQHVSTFILTRGLSSKLFHWEQYAYAKESIHFFCKPNCLNPAASNRRIFSNEQLVCVDVVS